MTGNQTKLCLVAASAAIAAGCEVCRTAHKVAVAEPKLYCEHEDEKASLATYRSLADQVWAESGLACPDGCLEGDFAWGFREGFADYVYAGGSGQPPVVPPRPYWQVDMRSPEGSAAVNSWFEGYRQDARVARDSGHRRTATLVVSASLDDCDACGCPDRGASCPTDGCPAPTPLEPELMQPTEVVPLPRSAEDDQSIELPIDQATAPKAPALRLDSGMAFAHDGPSLDLPSSPRSTAASRSLATDSPNGVTPRSSIFQIVR